MQNGLAFSGGLRDANAPCRTGKKIPCGPGQRRRGRRERQDPKNQASSGLQAAASASLRA